MQTTRKFTILLYDASWGLSILRPVPDDPVYEATSNYSLLPQADIVVFHVPTAPRLLPLPKCPGQVWAAYSLESDVYYPQQNDSAYMGHFDITMTYRQHSDVPLMYWWPELRRPLVAPPGPKTTDAAAAYFSSNLVERSGRTDYVRELMLYLKIDCYGRAFRNQEVAQDEGRATKLETISRYRFDLAFENSLSLDYVSEKFFDPLISGCVPVYRGAPNIEEFAPGEHCYINAADFQSPKHLAEYLLHLENHPDEYHSYFAWKEQPLRESFLKKITIAEKDPFRRLCDLMLARGYQPRAARSPKLSTWFLCRQANDR